MKIVEVEFTDEAYDALCEEAKRREVSVAEIVRRKADPIGEEAKRPWAFTPLNLGVPKLPVSEWRLAANERPDDE